MTVIEEIAAWVSGLNYDDIPERVLDVARQQRVSVFGASFAGARCGGGKAVLDTVERLGETGPCMAFPGGESRTLENALLQNCALSMALDYDDYLFLGHTGHSAVTVPLAVAEARGGDPRVVLAAQVAANELAGRLGGSVALGPHNGQMWAHIHLLGSAAAASMVLGLDAERTANAIGIALAEPVYALFPGFMGPQSKLLTAAVPSITGTLAALLAESGMTGSRAIIDDPEGFWSHFSFLPLPFMMTGLGGSWVTDTIAFKPYPGCAYIDTAVDALLEIMRAFREQEGRELDPAEVRSVDVRASLLTIAMDSMSQEYLDPSHLSPTNINFSLSVSLGIVLLAGTLSGAQLTEQFLTERRQEILAEAGKVALAHDAGLSVGFVRALDEVVDLKAMLEQINARPLMKARHRLGEHLSGVATMGARDALDAWKSLSRADRDYLKSLVSVRSLFTQAAPYDLGDKLLEQLTLPFGARVRVTLAGGNTLEAEKLIPRGGPGDPMRAAVPVEKFKRESAGFLKPEQADAAMEVLLDPGNRPVSELRAALTAGRTA